MWRLGCSGVLGGRLGGGGGRLGLRLRLDRRRILGLRRRGGSYLLLGFCSSEIGRSDDERSDDERRSVTLE